MHFPGRSSPAAVQGIFSEAKENLFSDGAHENRKKSNATRTKVAAFVVCREFFSSQYLKLIHLVPSKCFPYAIRFNVECMA
jgi:hypothetical protein